MNDSGTAETGASTPSGGLAALDPRRWRPFFADVDKEVWVVCLVAAVALTFHEMVFNPSRYDSIAHDLLPNAQYWATSSDGRSFRGVLRYIWWTGGTTLVWVVLPLLTARLLLGRRPSDYGLRRLPLKKLAPYLLILAGMVPVLIAAAAWLPGFNAKYPFLSRNELNWTGRNLLLFELVYGAQFFAVETFFRGYLVQGLGRTLGARAILVTMVPYVMIHFHKPMAEALAASLAGIALGAFALQSGSIWGGLIIHLGVAWGMDLTAILMYRGFPDSW